METRLAQDTELSEIFANVHSEWPHHKSLDEHVKLRLASPQHKFAQWFCIRDDKGITASLGAYPFLFSIGGQSINGIAIGAIHTVERARGQGLASKMIKQVNEYYKDRNYGISLLYSDIGERFYESLGYEVIPTYHGEIKRAAHPNVKVRPVALEQCWAELESHQRSFENYIEYPEDHKKWISQRFEIKCYEVASQNLAPSKYLIASYEQAMFLLAATTSQQSTFEQKSIELEGLADACQLDKIKVWYSDRPGDSQYPIYRPAESAIPMVSWLDVRLKNQGKWLIQPIYHV